VDLILWRHAEAEEIREGQLDSDRLLTAKGRRQATKMALWLRAHLPAGTRVLASPARRTQETATHLGLPYTTDTRLAIGQSPDDALLAADWLDGIGACLLVGHQPMLGQIIGKLLASEASEWPVKKGAIWWFSNGNGEGNRIGNKVTLHAVLSAKDIQSRKF
jgi:phosphohistidine phosphatase